MPYRIERRLQNKQNGKPLSGFAIDITIRANREGAYFLEDHNSAANVMPHYGLADLLGTLVSELVRNDKEHFPPAKPKPAAAMAEAGN
jgi:hypothetical protein